MPRDDDGPTLEISAGGTRIVGHLYAPRRSKPPMTRDALRDWLARKRRSRFTLIAGGLPQIATPPEEGNDAKS